MSVKNLRVKSVRLWQQAVGDMMAVKVDPPQHYNAAHTFTMIMPYIKYLSLPELLHGSKTAAGRLVSYCVSICDIIQCVGLVETAGVTCSAVLRFS